MSLGKSLIERRQLLLAAVGSTCALTCKKLAAFASQDGAGAAKSAPAAITAHENVSAASLKAAGNRCPHLLSPLRIRNRVLKNRILHTVSPTYFMQGPENYPTEIYRNHYSNMAKNAAIVSMSTHYNLLGPRTSHEVDLHNDDAFSHYSDRAWDNLTQVYNYVNEMMDDIHYQGSLILFAGNTGRPGVMPAAPAQGGAPGGTAQAGGAPGGGGAPGAAPGGAAQGGGAPAAAAQGEAASAGPAKNVDEIVAEAKEYEFKGYDVYQFNSSSLEAAKRIREETNLILIGRYNIDAQHDEPPQPTAAELEKGVEHAKKLEGLVDILWIRVSAHPNGWNQDKGRPKGLAYAQAIKKAGIKIITCPSAGFHDPVENDEFIASGKTDMVGMATPFFADPEFVRKVKEGRAEDILPCLGCQDCHGIGMRSRPWYSTCAVNPTWGLPPYQLKSITPAKISKKVAVVGGGPAGMKAALVAAERGHKVTLYEKDAALGGLQKTSDTSQWRWGHTGLKEYYVHQLKKAGVVVKLNTAATPELVKAAKYDTVLVATGNDLVPSSLKTDGGKVFNILDSYYKKNELGKHVVVVGGGKLAFEAGVCMLKDGHKVTVLAPGKELVESELQGPHNMRNQMLATQNNPDFTSVLEAKGTDITGGKVTYTDSSGKENSVQADSVVVYSGLRPRMDEAVKFIGSADEVLFLGDCTGTNGTLQKTIRSAFFVASQV